MKAIISFMADDVIIFGHSAACVLRRVLNDDDGYGAFVRFLGIFSNKLDSTSHQNVSHTACNSCFFSSVRTSRE